MQQTDRGYLEPQILFRSVSPLYLGNQTERVQYIDLMNGIKHS
jgi:hypothetical protein